VDRASPSEGRVGRSNRPGGTFILRDATGVADRLSSG